MGQPLETQLAATKIGTLNVELRGESPPVVCRPSLYHRVVVVEGPGHGRSGSSPGPFSFVSPIIADKMFSPHAPGRSAMFEREDLIPLLPDVRAPTLFFAGADDSIFPVDEAQRQAAAIPGCRFVVVEKSSHQSALEAPDQVVPIVRRALADWSNADAAETRSA